MGGLTDEAGGVPPAGEKTIRDAHRAWQASMTRRMQMLRAELQEDTPQIIADRSGASFQQGALHLTYWDASLRIEWPALKACLQPTGEPCSTFDTAILLYYLHTADGTRLADRWIGFRELPDGTFYHQAFQGYSGDLLAKAFGPDPPALEPAARHLGGDRLPDLAPFAFAFTPLPRIRLAAALWPGDEDFPSRASILFDAAAPHYMTTDGLALLGAGLARRLLRGREAPSNA